MSGSSSYEALEEAQLLGECVTHWTDSSYEARGVTQLLDVWGLSLAKHEVWPYVEASKIHV